MGRGRRKDTRRGEGRAISGHVVEKAGCAETEGETVWAQSSLLRPASGDSCKELKVSQPDS